MRVKVLRPFCLKGERQEPGTELEFADAFARELIFLGKAERVEAAPIAPPKPLTTESAPALVGGKSAPKGAGAK